MYPHTAAIPKCMVTVNGATIIDCQLDQLATAGIESVVVVSGFEALALRRHVGSRSRGMDISYVHAVDFATTNNIVSLYLAREAIDGLFMLLESDVCAEPGIIDSLVEPSSAAVARYHPSMDGTVVGVGDDGMLSELIVKSRQRHAISLDRYYKTVNLWSLSYDLWTGAVLPRIEHRVGNGHTDQYYETAIGETIAAGRGRIRAVDVTSRRWMEIDCPHDLSAAEALFAESA